VGYQNEIQQDRILFSNVGDEGNRLATSPLVRKGVDVNEHERLSNISLRHKIK